MPCGADKVPIHAADELDWNFLGTNGFAFAVIGAAAKDFLLHGRDHIERSLIPLRLSLGKHVEVCNLGCREEHGGGIRAGGNARAAADAGRRIESRVGRFLRYQNSPGVRCASGGHADESAGLNDAVKSRSIHDQIADHREGACSPRLQHQRVAIFKKSHRELANCGAAVSAVRYAIHQKAAGAADTFAAIMFKGHWLLTLGL